LWKGWGGTWCLEIEVRNFSGGWFFEAWSLLSSFFLKPPGNVRRRVSNQNICSRAPHRQEAFQSNSPFVNPSLRARRLYYRVLAADGVSRGGIPEFSLHSMNSNTAMRAGLDTTKKDNKANKVFWILVSLVGFVIVCLLIYAAMRIGK